MSETWNGWRRPVPPALVPLQPGDGGAAWLSLSPSVSPKAVAARSAADGSSMLGGAAASAARLRSLVASPAAGCSVALGAVGLGAASLRGVAFHGSSLATVDGPVSGVVFVEEIGAALVRDCGALVLGGRAAVRGDGVGESVGGGVRSGDHILAAVAFAPAQLGAAVGQGRAPVAIG